MKKSNPTIAVLSGKGGTGKTLVSVNLAAATAGAAVYVDCDVEEPNGHLFFKPEITSEETVSAKIPSIDLDRCNGCRKCVDFCKFNALAFIKNKTCSVQRYLSFCGWLRFILPAESNQRSRKERWRDSKRHIRSGARAYRLPEYRGGFRHSDHQRAPEEECVRNRVTGFIDCPPGSACIVMESIKDADYCVLVAEPTVFGVHNLKMVCDLVEVFHKPHGVVLNKCLEGETQRKYSAKNTM
jgi:MinD superfamily P-loop ATPase